jgi:hypothetical protein
MTGVRATEICEQEGCDRRGESCWLPDDPPDGPSHHYCWEHAHGAGFCHCCGVFWGGIETFDFSPSGLCENCAIEINGAHDDDEGDWDFDPAEDRL